MTLTEVVIALGLVAVLLPLALGVMSGTFNSARNARDDTRSAMIARALVVDLDVVDQQGRSEWFEQVPGALIPGSEEAQFFSFDDDGNWLAAVEEADWQNGLDAPRASYLVRISGEDYQTASGANCRRVTLEVTSPAPAALAARNQFQYHALFER